MARVAGIHQPEAFPWLGFLDKARQSDVFILLDDVQYSKNYFQNRNKIRTAGGSTWLTIPALTSGRSDQLIKDVEIQDSANPRWREKQMSAWTQTYGKAPFGSKYLPLLQAVYAKGHKLLADFNRDVIALLFKEFSIGAEVVRSSSLKTAGASSEKLLALCREVEADVYLSGISGREYLDEKLFVDARIEVRYQDFRHPIYRQRFEPFMPCMSAFDALFNLGPEAARLLADPSAPRLAEAFT